MPKITKKDISSRDSITVKTKSGASGMNAQHRWWRAKSKDELIQRLLDASGYLKQQQQYRYRQAGLYARMYGNLPTFNYAGANLVKTNISNTLPVERPTMNVIQSCIDTLTSRIAQSKPRPIFLTDNADYKERKLAKQMNSFINGELYQTGAYKVGELLLRDAAVWGTAAVKIYEDANHRVALDRVVITELLVDPNDAIYGCPRSLYHFKLIDRDVLIEEFPGYKAMIEAAEQAYPDQSSDSQKTIADQIMCVEGWHLPSGPDANDGRHVIGTTAGILLDEKYEKEDFPFVFLQYSPSMLGFWGQGLAEQLTGTQVEINKILMTISQSINLVGVPRVFVEAGSKVIKAHLNNSIGAIVTYQGTKPIYEVAPCVPQELYAQLERLIQFAYQQSGISALAASAQKPAGLNSGEAIRSYDDLQSDRFASISKRYDNMFIDLAYKIIDKAKDIAEEQGEYKTVYPNKDGTKEIDLPASKMLDNPFVIQCYDSSSLPRDPAGRLQKVTEMMQSGLISPQEGRRLLDFPDIEQVDKLANSAEERILQQLDQIVEEGVYTPPDPFMDLALAEVLVSQYYNLYVPAKLEEERAQMLRDFFTQIQTLKQAAMPPPPPVQPTPAAQAAGPQAVPQPRPVSDLLANIPQQ